MARGLLLLFNEPPEGLNVKGFFKRSHKPNCVGFPFSLYVPARGQEIREKRTSVPLLLTNTATFALMFRRMVFPGCSLPAICIKKNSQMKIESEWNFLVEKSVVAISAFK